MEGWSVRGEEKPVNGKSVRNEEKTNCRSWVVEMEKMLVETDSSEEMARWNKPSIYRVPEWIKDTTNSEAYRPQLVSLGPFHHGEPKLLPMEEHKRRAVLHRVKRAGKPLSEFVTAVEGVVAELQSAYYDLDDKWCGDNSGRFVEMMVTDGCFLLEFMETTDPRQDHDYAPNDPVFSQRGDHYLWADIRTDMVVMENQLPLLLLQKLLAISHDTPTSGKEINNKVLKFLDCSVMEGINNLGLHPLDLFHKSSCGPTSTCDQGSSQCKDDDIDSTPTIVELSEAGIHFKKSNTRRVNDVEFKNGVLSMPYVAVYDETYKMLLNQMVFERLHCDDAGTDVMDYIFFLDNIIDSGRDVALLRSKGLFNNGLGTDKEAADLFNTLSKGTVMSKYSKLNNVQRELNAHCMKRRNKWRANFVQTYLSNPWVFISLVAAIILLVSSFLQTVYTIVPFYTRS
ncbi:unnamed protein product [Urochloa decumbens]|uniref:Uncharacterized protein n=1 Tax=Urochloa decumbens TaxID=240449 RepID=A0ABC9AWK6_9POAL